MAAVRQAVASYAYTGSMPIASLIEVQVGGFMSFVLNIDHFEQV